MALMITDECVFCVVCEAECPHNAIYEDEEQYQITASKCTECVGTYNHPQCMDVCPVGAITYDTDNPETEEALIIKFKSLTGEHYPEDEFDYEDA